LRAPAGADDQREHDREQRRAALQVVRTREQRGRPARADDHGYRREDRSALGNGQRHEGARREQRHEHHTLHPRVGARREGQPHVVELEEAAAEASEQPQRVSDPDA
jgi:hypothetical protein